jgi:hypothetical protein
MDLQPTISNINLRVSDSTYNTQVDTDIYFQNDYKVVNNNYFLGEQTGTAGSDIDAISISLDVYQRISDAANTASLVDKPTPNTLSKSSAWLVGRFFASNKKSPKFINAIHDGGIMLEYYIEPHLYIMLELFDDGDIVCLVKKEGVRKTYSLSTGNEVYTLIQPILDGGSLR